MKQLALIAVAAATLTATPALAQRAAYDGMIASAAAAHGVPASLVHRVVQRESGYRAGLVGRCGCYGLMQIKPATARGIGYTGSPQGLLDASTNLHYGTKYLAGAWQLAGGSESRAISLYAGGYYNHAKRAGVTQQRRSREAYAFNAEQPAPRASRRRAKQPDNPVSQLFRGLSGN